MKKSKLLVCLTLILTIAVLFSGCLYNDVGVKINADGTGEVSVTVGISKDFYETLASSDDPFDGAETVERVYDGQTYITATEVTSYNSFEEMEAFLLELTSHADELEDTDTMPDSSFSDDGWYYESDIWTDSEGGLTMDDSNDIWADDSDDIIEEDTTTESSTLFSSVNIEKDGNSFIFKAVTTATESPADYNINDILKFSLTVEMPNEITDSNADVVEGNIATFNIDDLSQACELSVVCSASNSNIFADVNGDTSPAGTIIGVIVGILGIVAVGLFAFTSKKKAS